MGIVSGIINTGRITDLAEQIKFTDDPEALKYIVSSHAKEIGNLVSKASQESSKLRSLMKPVLQVPAPTSASIVAWCRKSIAATAIPQVAASVQYTQQLMSLGSGLGSIVSSVTSIKDKLDSLGINPIVDGIGDSLDVINRLQNDTMSEINGSITSALGEIETSQQAIESIIPGYAQLDTSSPQAFSASAEANMGSMQALADEFLATPVDPVVELEPVVVPTADTAPVDPEEGTLWYDPVALKLKIYFNDTWTQI